MLPRSGSRGLDLVSPLLKQRQAGTHDAPNRVHQKCASSLRPNIGSAFYACCKLSSNKSVCFEPVARGICKSAGRGVEVLGHNVQLVLGSRYMTPFRDGVVPEARGLVTL